MSDELEVDAFEAALTSNSASDSESNSEEPTAQVAVAEVHTETDTETEVDPNAEFRAALHNAPGEWFVIHSYAGYEKKVKANLQNRINTLHMEDYIHQIEVPEIGRAHV